MLNEQVQQKIRSLSELAEIIVRLKKEGKTIVQCHGVFDLLHPGHIKYFHSAKREGDVLIVTLTADKYVKRGPGRPIFNESIRAEVIASLAAVDYVCVLHEATAIGFIKKVKPNIYAKGPDYKDKKNINCTCYYKCNIKITAANRIQCKGGE